MTFQAWKIPSLNSVTLQDVCEPVSIEIYPKKTVNAEAEIIKDTSEESCH